LTETDLLFVIAEVGVALAGFSAVIGVLGSRRGTSDTRVDALRLQVMLESSLIVVAAAIIPSLLAHLGIEPRTSWRIASALFLLVQVPGEFLAVKRTRQMPDMKLSWFNTNSINWGLSLGADLIMLGVLLDLFGARSNGCYMLAIFLLLVMSGLLFIQFAASTFIPRGE